MSRAKDIDKELAITYRSHNIAKADNKYVCQDCKRNVWDEDFPEFCIGPTTILTLGKISSTDEIYNLEAKLFHIHNKTLIEFLPPAKLSSRISIEFSKSELENYIEKLEFILKTFEDKNE